MVECFPISLCATTPTPATIKCWQLHKKLDKRRGFAVNSLTGKQTFVLLTVQKISCFSALVSWSSSCGELVHKFIAAVLLLLGSFTSVHAKNSSLKKTGIAGNTRLQILLSPGFLALYTGLADVLLAWIIWRGLCVWLCLMAQILTIVGRPRGLQHWGFGCRQQTDLSRRKGRYPSPFTVSHA